MTSKFLRGVVGLAVLVSMAACAPGALAFCGSCGGGTVAAYQPATYTAGYAPVAYTTNYGGSSGWWPGCCLSWLWGGSSYTAAYQPTYAVSYASYAPACTTCSPCSTCTTNYSPCTSCAPVQQVSLRPVCATSYAPACGVSACSSCAGAGCASCGTTAVMQATYQEPACPSCANGSSGQTVIIQNGGAAAPPSGTSGGAVEQPPYLGTGENPAAERTFETQRQSNGANGIQPEPADDSQPNMGTPNNGTTDPLDDIMNEDANSTYFQAPRLFNPNDRAAQRGVAAPVRTAVYERPASYRPVSTGPITAAQARQDAAGWSSSSK